MNPNTVSPKVSAAAGAAGGSTPLSIVICWAIGLLGLTVPPEVAVSIGALVASGSALLAGYFVPGHIQIPAP